MTEIKQTTKELCLKLALAPEDKSEVKSRIMKLYEFKIITAGDVERIFAEHDLRAA